MREQLLKNINTRMTFFDVWKSQMTLDEQANYQRGTEELLEELMALDFEAGELL